MTARCRCSRSFMLANDIVDPQPDQLEDLRAEAEIGQKWRKDSSLETWFPFTAKELATLRAECERLRARTEQWASSSSSDAIIIDRLRKDLKTHRELVTAQNQNLITASHKFDEALRLMGPCVTALGNQPEVSY